MAGVAEAAPIAPPHVGDPGHVEYFDVLIVGAGLSGIAAAYHLQTKCPAKTYAILDGRSAIGGTWDLFRYPGVRSDSDMHTLGYPFRPWRDSKAIADGSSIRTIHRGNGSRIWHRPQDSVWPSGHACVVVVAGCRVDG